MLQVWTLVGVCVGIGVIALLVMAIGVDDVPPQGGSTEERETCMASTVSSLKAVLSHTKKKTQLLLIPHTIALDLTKAFFRSDFNKVKHTLTANLKVVPCNYDIDALSFHDTCCNMKELEHILHVY